MSKENILTWEVSHLDYSISYVTKSNNQIRVDLARSAQPRKISALPAKYW